MVKICQIVKNYKYYFLLIPKRLYHQQTAILSRSQQVSVVGSSISEAT